MISALEATSLVSKVREEASDSRMADLPRLLNVIDKSIRGAASRGLTTVHISEVTIKEAEESSAFAKKITEELQKERFSFWWAKMNNEHGDGWKYLVVSWRLPI